MRKLAIVLLIVSLVLVLCSCVGAVEPVPEPAVTEIPVAPAPYISSSALRTFMVEVEIVPNPDEITVLLNGLEVKEFLKLGSTYRGTVHTLELEILNYGPNDLSTTISYNELQWFENAGEESSTEPFPEWLDVTLSPSQLGIASGESANLTLDVAVSTSAPISNPVFIFTIK